MVLIQTFLQALLSAPGELHDVYVISGLELDYRSYDTIAHAEMSVVQTGKVYSLVPVFRIIVDRADNAEVQSEVEGSTSLAVPQSITAIAMVFNWVVPPTAVTL